MRLSPKLRACLVLAVAIVVLLGHTDAVDERRLVLHGENEVREVYEKFKREYIKMPDLDWMLETAIPTLAATLEESDLGGDYLEDAAQLMYLSTQYGELEKGMDKIKDAIELQKLKVFVDGQGASLSDVMYYMYGKKWAWDNNNWYYPDDPTKRKEAEEEIEAMQKTVDNIFEVNLDGITARGKFLANSGKKRTKVPWHDRIWQPEYEEKDRIQVLLLDDLTLHRLRHDSRFRTVIFTSILSVRFALPVGFIGGVNMFNQLHAKDILGRIISEYTQARTEGYSHADATRTVLIDRVLWELVNIFNLWLADVSNGNFEKKESIVDFLAEKDDCKMARHPVFRLMYNRTILLNAHVGVTPTDMDEWKDMLTTNVWRFPSFAKFKEGVTGINTIAPPRDVARALSTYGLVVSLNKMALLNQKIMERFTNDNWVPEAIIIPEIGKSTSIVTMSFFLHNRGTCNGIRCWEGADDLTPSIIRGASHQKTPLKRHEGLAKSNDIKVIVLDDICASGSQLFKIVEHYRKASPRMDLRVCPLIQAEQATRLFQKENVNSVMGMSVDLPPQLVSQLDDNYGEGRYYIVFPYMSPNNDNRFFSYYIAPMFTFHSMGVKGRLDDGSIGSIVRRWEIRLKAIESIDHLFGTRLDPRHSDLSSEEMALRSKAPTWIKFLYAFNTDPWLRLLVMHEYEGAVELGFDDSDVKAWQVSSRMMSLKILNDAATQDKSRRETINAFIDSILLWAKEVNTMWKEIKNEGDREISSEFTLAFARPLKTALGDEHPCCDDCTCRDKIQCTTCTACDAVTLRGALVSLNRVAPPVCRRRYMALEDRDIPRDK